MKIRTATVKDAEKLLAIYTPYIKETAITFEYEVPNLEEFQKRIEQTLVRYPYLVAETEEGTVVGYAYAGPYKTRTAYDWTAEVTVYVDQSVRAKGIGSQLYQALEELLTKQNVVNVAACITAGNDQSVRFHEKRGYQLVARFPHLGFKFDKWYDILWLQKTLAKPQEKQAAFIPFAELNDSLK